MELSFDLSQENLSSNPVHYDYGILTTKSFRINPISSVPIVRLNPPFNNFNNLATMCQRISNPEDARQKMHYS